MRHRFFLIATYNAKTLSPKGMSKCPWRKGKQFDLHPGGVIEPHTSSQGHSGNMPAGKTTKAKRIKSGPPGSPNGICTGNSGSCNCGKHLKNV